MNIVKSIASGHGGLVFIDLLAAEKRDLTQVVGRFDKSTNSLVVLDAECPKCKKVAALVREGWKPAFVAVGPNWYICQNAVAGDAAISVSEAVVSTELPNNSASDPAPAKSKRTPVVFRSRVVGMMEDDEFYLSDEFAAASEFEYDIYQDDGEPYYCIDEIDSDGVQTLDRLINDLNNKPANDHKIPVTESVDIELFDLVNESTPSPDDHAIYVAEQIINAPKTISTNTDLLSQTLAFM
ncbi:hypothetical protein [Aeromonas hydrophila]|nr:hypothetical protein [Aeromonas hydrophila]AGM44170.1 hypothetical protein AHML_11950 [Aeromonas hydrophila ML09-119]AHX32843.1 hypothetical protein V428_12335 [Aeromonas hydrophila subsp. hydrophila AL09-71]AHX69641.1 hypothetical protein V429_12350 [Aeromonas hydrophila pc104A]AJE38618.1 hypothetical protein V469_10725 [Aeromonas hydrophila J-1]AKJ37046.1 hypothetical protein U876_11135 [Aeromonas hydrophila NJ-35]